MVKRPNLTDIVNVGTSASTHNTNNDEINTAFDNTLSRDGSTPNQMEADIDLNDNDLLNVRRIYAENVIVSGSSIEAAFLAADQAVSAASEAETSLAAAEAAQASAENSLTLANAAAATADQAVVDAEAAVAAAQAISDATGVVTVNPQTGTAYTLVLSDSNNCVTMSNGASNVVTVPSGVFDVGTVISIIQLGVGSTTVTFDTGVTGNGVSAGSAGLTEQHSAVSLLQVATDVWNLSGAHNGVA